MCRLADRGKLPGRKVGGEWRFSRAEIHHWMERRIGLSDEEELLEVEGVLDRTATQEETEISIGELLPLEAIAIPLAARTAGSVIRSMVDLAAGTGWLWDPEENGRGGPRPRGNAPHRAGKTASPCCIRGGP